MPDFVNWYSSSITPVAAELRALMAWERIQDRPTSVTLDRGGVAQAAQTVRLEYSSPHTVQGEVGKAGEYDLVVFGVKDHPTVTDTNIKRGDRFAVGKLVYEVLTVANVPGEVQAWAKRLEG